jgi:hypothetical protein
MTRRLVLLGAALLAASLLGTWGLQPGPAAASPAGAGAPWVWIGALGLGGTGWWWFRRQRARRRADLAERLRCLQRLQLEPGSCLHLVEVDGRELLLASGPAGVRLLTRLPKGGTP